MCLSNSVSFPFSSYHLPGVYSFAVITSAELNLGITLWLKFSSRKTSQNSLIGSWHSTEMMDGVSGQDQSLHKEPTTCYDCQREQIGANALRNISISFLIKRVCLQTKLMIVIIQIRLCLSNYSNKLIKITPCWNFLRSQEEEVQASPVVSPAEFQCGTSSNLVFFINCSRLQANERLLLTMLSTENTECF